MTRHPPVFGGIVGIVALGDTLEIGKFCLNGLDEVSVGNELLHLPLVSVEWHVLQNEPIHVSCQCGSK